MVFYVFPLHVSPYFQRHSNALTLVASRYTQEGTGRQYRCDYVKSFYYYMTLSLTILQCRSKTRVLWGTTTITTVVPNRPLGVDVLAINCKVEGYVGHTSNSAVYSSVPVPMNSQQTARKNCMAFSTSCEGKTVLFRGEVLNNWQRSFKLAISSNLNVFVFI